MLSYHYFMCYLNIITRLASNVDYFKSFFQEFTILYLVEHMIDRYFPDFGPPKP